MDPENSTPSQTVATLSTVVLNGPSQWNDWIFIIRYAAESRQVWQYIDPGTGAQPVEPVRPTKPVLPEELDDEYEMEERKFNRFHTAMTDIRNLVLKTINKDYTAFFEDPEIKTLWQGMRLLRNDVAPSDRARELFVTAEYEALRRTQRRHSVEDWVNRFLNVYTDAKLLNLPIVSNDRAQLDFLQAVAVWEVAWSNTKLIEFIDAPEETKPTLLQLMASFRKFRSITDAARALANARTQQEGMPIAAAVASAQGKRVRAPECLCHEHHFWDECPYLNGKMRPILWSPVKAIEEEIVQKLKSNERLKDMVQKRIAGLLERHPRDRKKKKLNRNNVVPSGKR